MLRNSHGVVLECGSDGRIEAVIFENIGVSHQSVIGLPFTTLVNTESVPKALDFLSNIKAESAQFDWELNFVIAGRSKALYCAGALDGTRILIIAGENRHDLDSMLEDMQRINNEQINHIRTLRKSMTAGQRDRSDSETLEELTKLNNEFANVQRELSKKNSELSHANERKSTLLGMAAHDLRNPLGVITTYAELLELTAGAKLSTKELAILANIRLSSAFMLRLIEDLLMVSRAETGKLALELVPTDFGRLVQDNVTRNSVLAQSRSIDLLCEIAPEIAVVTIDPGKIEQVLNNLISNAVKFSPVGGQVMVSVNQTGPKLTVAVADHGPGIPERDLPKLFLPFSRTSVASRTGEPSTGLGLSICKNIVEGHGGQITVESRCGQGSTFRFTVPSGPEAAA